MSSCQASAATSGHPAVCTTPEGWRPGATAELTAASGNVGGSTPPPPAGAGKSADDADRGLLPGFPLSVQSPALNQGPEVLENQGPRAEDTPIWEEAGAPPTSPRSRSQGCPSPRPFLLPPRHGPCPPSVSPLVLRAPVSAGECGAFTLQRIELLTNISKLQQGCESVTGLLPPLEFPGITPLGLLGRARRAENGSALNSARGKEPGLQGGRSRVGSLCSHAGSYGSGGWKCPAGPGAVSLQKLLFRITLIPRTPAHSDPPPPRILAGSLQGF